MQDSMVMFTLFIFDRKYHFWVNLVQKNQNCLFELKFDKWTNLDIQNSTIMLTFSAFDENSLFG